jgi:hypothetical protein
MVSIRKCSVGMRREICRVEIPLQGFVVRFDSVGSQIPGVIFRTDMRPERARSGRVTYPPATLANRSLGSGLN